MRIMNFINSLLKFFKKDEVVEDIRITEDELTSVVIPITVTVGFSFKDKGFKSKVAKEIEKTFRGIFKDVRKREPTFIGDIAYALINVKANLQYVHAEIENLLEEDIIKDGLTARKAALIRAAEQISFISRFTLDLADYICIEEAKATKIQSSIDDLPPIKVKRINELVADYARMLVIYAKDTKEFKELVSDIPEVVLNDTTLASLVSVYGEKKLDPIDPRLVRNFQYSPVYMVQMTIAEWQAMRYKACRDKKKMLELRLLDLEQRNSNNPDPKLQAEIDYIKNRVEGYEHKMEQLEG